MTDAEQKQCPFCRSTLVREKRGEHGYIRRCTVCGYREMLSDMLLSKTALKAIMEMFRKNRLQ